MKHNHRNILKVTTLASTVAAATLSLAQATYHITELAPAAGYSSTVGYALNDRGEAVGASQPIAPYFNGVATLWRNGQSTILGKVPKGNYSTAEAISSLGVITGEGDDGSFRPQAVTFKGGVASIFDSGANNSRGIFVSDNGFIVGDYLKGFGNAGWNPAIWTADPKKPGQYKRLFLPHYADPTGAASYNYANGANNLGQVVGQISSSQWSARGGLWNTDSAHSLTLLSPLPNEWDSYANGINDLGVIVGISDVGVFSTTPVVWSADASHTVQALPLLPNEAFGYAVGINNSGQIIGSHGSLSQPCVWIDGQLIDLQAALDATGAGWTLSGVSDINNSGQIVGTGMFNGQARGFVLTPNNL